MKKTFILLIFVGSGFTINAQKTKVVPKPTTKPAAKPVLKPVSILKTHNDSLSYVLGEMSAFNLIQQGFGDIKINEVAFSKAATDIMSKKQTLIDDLAANALLNNYMGRLQEEKAKARIDSGKVFLSDNAKRKEVKTTASGLQYEILTEGTGIKPTTQDTFVVNYRGTLINGTEFDASANRGTPLKMALTSVIPGWTEGLQLMNVGSKFKLFVPYTLGYGVYDNGPIPGGSTLIFEMELVDVKKKGHE
ncbi:MAG: FKBP-type peptidyl-prolyl cis-trans isomerase [Bacteroidetes bacterium]|nr:FKBP-type peptidyl-prolyl cis-trans isomerase [Bacteroidota bacterium]